MDEQRILEEMERMLAADDPRLAARLAAFGQPGFGQALRTRRARATLSVLVLVLIAAVASVLYIMSSFRPGTATHGPRQTQHSAAPPHRPATHPAGQLASAAPSVRTGRPAGQRAGRRGPAQCAATWAPGCGGWPAASGRMPLPSAPQAARR